MSVYQEVRAVVSAAPGAAADTQVLPAPGSGKRYVIKNFWCVVSAAATHARFRSGTNEIFTGGGAAAGIPLGANGGLSIQNAGEDPSEYWFATLDNQVLNFRTEVACELTVGVVAEVRNV